MLESENSSIDLRQLTRREAAARLTRHGYKTSAATLASKATRGGGPPFRKYGRYTIYEPNELLEWARSQLTPVIRSTSELHAPQQPK